MFTSYYARDGHHPNAVSISAKPPDWYHGVTAPGLAPSWDLIMNLKDGTISEREFVIGYLALLKKRKVTAHMVASLISHDSVLLCHEASGFCHRHIVAYLMEQALGQPVPELADFEKQTNLDRFCTF